MYIRPVTAVSAAWIVTGLDARTSSLGYGNISRRAPGEADGLIITASEASDIADVGAGELVRIRRVDLRRFRVEAEGAPAEYFR